VVCAVSVYPANEGSNLVGVVFDSNLFSKPSKYAISSMFPGF
jgi:hypothetical protein